MTPLEKSKDPMSINLTIRDGLDPTEPGSDSLNYIQQQSLLSEPSGWNSSPAQTKEGAPFPTTHLGRICQGLHKQRSGSQSHREKIAERPHPRSQPLHPSLSRGLLTGSAGTTVTVLQRERCQFTRSCWPPSPAPSSSPQPRNHSRADTLCPQSIYKTPLPKTSFSRYGSASQHQLWQPNCMAGRCSTRKKWSRASNNLTLHNFRQRSTSGHAVWAGEKHTFSPPDHRVNVKNIKHCDPAKSSAVPSGQSL